MNKDKVIIFKGKNIRRIWHNEKWFFSVIDVIGVLTESNRARKYWFDLKKNLLEEGFELSEKIGQLKLKSPDGKYYETDCGDTETIFRIIQSIPSKKAEPFKRWLAKVGYERIKEIENPEMAQERMKKLYELKGYSKDWIDKRLRGIVIRQGLTDEWKNRDLKENVEYAILTDEISKSIFGKTVEEYKDFKNLDKENLRDHMDDFELIFSMLGEKVTTEITINKDAIGFGECAIAARQGGEVAGNARKETEQKIGRSIVSEENFKQISEKKKKTKLRIKVKNE